MNYYGRRYYSRYRRRFGRRAYSSSSRSKRRAIGNYKAALQQKDVTQINLSCSHIFDCFNGEVRVPNYDHGKNTLQTGVYALNIWDLLRRSEFYESYSKMYDQVKINSIRVKITPMGFKTIGNNSTVNAGIYYGYTVVTAWDRTGLSEGQAVLIGDPDSTSVNIGDPNDDYGFYVNLNGKNIATYSSAVTKSMNAGSNTAITRFLYPSTVAEKGYYCNTADLQQWYTGFEGNTDRYWGVLNPSLVKGQEEVVSGTPEKVYETAPLYSLPSLAKPSNPAFLMESALVPFKPTLLVGLLNEEMVYDIGEGQQDRIIPAAKFSLEADIGLTFRGLRKAPIIA
jgi:hypothetical protein